jgi:hypothetical protein
MRSRRQEVKHPPLPACISSIIITFSSSIDASPSALIACADAAAAQILWFNVIKCTHADSWLLAGLSKVLAFDSLRDVLGTHLKDSAAAAAMDLVTLPPIITSLRPGGQSGFFPGALRSPFAFACCLLTAASRS